MRAAFLLVACFLFAGCLQAPHREESSTGSLNVHWGQEAIQADSASVQDNRLEVTKEPLSKSANPVDYNANAKGEYWEDGIIQSKSYELASGAVITTHTHGIVIYSATSIVIDGTVNVRDLGALPGEQGYSTTRAATLALYRGYGETDADSGGEPRLWGAGGADCRGGGYIILDAPQIEVNGVLDAGSSCGQGGVIYLEGTATGSGSLQASLIIRRGAL